MAKIGIVGAGLLGRLTAWRLLRAGHQVHLFDPRGDSGAGSCSWIGAGMLAPYAELEKAEPIIGELGEASLALWAKMLPSLPAPVYFQHKGSLIVAHRQDAAELGAFQRQVAARLADATAMEAVDAARLADLEPELAGRFSRGVYFANEGQIEPRDLLPALAQALHQLGATWTHTRVTEVAAGALTCEDGTHHRFDWVVDTRGLGARSDVARLRGVRGELLRLRAPEVHLNRPVRLMHPRYPIYIVPRPDQVYLVGATSIESEDTRAVTVKSSLELLSAAYSLHSGFAEAEVLASDVQHRPAFADNLPSISVTQGLIRANGLYRHGYLIGPAVAQAAAAVVTGEASPYPSLVEEHHATVR